MDYKVTLIGDKGTNEGSIKINGMIAGWWQLNLNDNTHEKYQIGIYEYGVSSDGKPMSKVHWGYVNTKSQMLPYLCDLSGDGRTYKEFVDSYKKHMTALIKVNNNL